MLFNSLDYMVFLAASVAVYWLLRRLRAPRLTFLFLVSCLFYMAWNPAYIVLILAPTLVDWGLAIAIEGAKTQARKRAFLVVSLSTNLGLLCTFKYFNFFAEVTAGVAGAIGHRFTPPFLDVLLPVGISFYTFQTLSYTIDVYRGRIRATRNLLDLGVFVTFFPQLVAGPIVRAADFLPQLRKHPSLRVDQVGRGLFLIALGLVKKVAFADYLSVNLVDRVFTNPELYSGTEVVIGLYGFTLQIYCDFSGYTDVARGSAMLLGIQLPENFDRPYMATNPAEFWRRWHMTLSSWLRDYLYFPLGGSQNGPVRAYFNLFLTMFLIGVWHGASWTFVIYGLLQGSAMVLHRFVHRRFPRPATAEAAWPMTALKIFACLQFVVFSRVLFRAADLDNAREVASRLWSGTSSVAQIAPGVAVALGLGFAAHYTPRSWLAATEQRFLSLPGPAKALALFAVGAVLSLVATSEVVPYIYFQF